MDCPWASLALVPADERASVEAVLTALRSPLLGPTPPATVIDARGVDPTEGKALAGRLRPDEAGATRFVVALDSPLTSLAAVHLALATERSLLVVRPGDGAWDNLVAAAGLVGLDRILGTVAAPAGA